MRTSSAKLASARAYKLKHKERLKEQGRAYNATRPKDEAHRQAAHLYQRRWERNNPNYEMERDPVKVSARNLVRQAIFNGQMERKPCEVCGDVNSEAHHDDYSKPMEVRFLCSKHHKEHHAKQ